MSILITNKRVVEFYEKHPDIDINTMNVMLIDMFEQIVNDKSGVDLAKELLNKFDGLKLDIKNNKLETLSRMNDALSDNKTDIKGMIKGEIVSDSFISQIDSKLHSQMKNVLNDSSIGGELTNKINTMDVKQDMLQKKFEEYVSRRENSNEKGRQSENELKAVLDDIFPTAEIEKISGEAHTCDIIIKREGLADILVENKDYKTKIPSPEVKKFISDTENKNKHGIFISQYSPIANKENFQVDIDGDRVLLYISSVNYDLDVIKTGVSIVDNFVKSMSKLNLSGETEIVQKKVLEKFNDEYKRFIVKRDTLVSKLKDNYNSLQEIIKELEMPGIDKFLTERFAHADSNILTCDICNIFKALNMKSLKRHKAHCLKKNNEVLISKIETEKT
jgi:hypothetical protein